MSRRKILHRKLYGRWDEKRKKWMMEYPSTTVTGTGRWMGKGLGKGETVTLPCKRGDR